MPSPYEDRWWYVERPFPWLLCMVFSAPVLALIAGISWLWLSFGCSETIHPL